MVQTRIHDFLNEAVTAKGAEQALIDFSDRTYSWDELQTAVDDAEAELKEVGLRPGDRVVLVFENCISVAAFIFAASRMDAIVVVVNARLTGAELERIIAHSDPSAVVFCTQASDTAQAHSVECSATKVYGAFVEAAIFKRASSTPEPVFSAPSEQVAILLYTSGTTGAPKAAMLTHGNLIAAAHASAKVRDMAATDMCYLALPLSHIFGLVTFLAVCSAKAAMRLEAKFSVERLYDALQSNVTHLPAVPQMHAHLFHYVHEQNKPACNRGVLRYVSSGGAPLDPVWKREAEAFYGLALQNGYGLTESAAGVCLTVNKLGDPDISAGRPMQGCILKLDMHSVGAEPDKGIGEILIGGPQVMKGYFRDADESAKVLTDDGFFRTGDLGRCDEEGRLHIAGRSKELIIRSGFNVYPVEVEAALTDHPEVIVAGVVGRAVSGNEEVLGFVKIAPDCTLTEADLKAFVHDKLAPYKRPSRIILAPDLPAAPTGKILKSKLIDFFSQDLGNPPESGTGGGT
jgi:acyl-CoA synthetase (AMP-forming)/AMP-acid ligase II